jgi:hypothetical protein
VSRLRWFGFLFFLVPWIGAAVTACSPKVEPEKLAVPRPAWSLEQSLAWIQEMSQVIPVAMSPEDRLGWAQAIASGASLEGVYRGWMQADHYRDTEKSSQAHAKDPTESQEKDFFAQEFSTLFAELKDQRAWTTLRLSRPRAEVVALGQAAEESLESPGVPALAVQIRGLIQTTPLPTLRRVLGELALDRLQQEAGAQVSLDLARSFGRMSKRVQVCGVSFGLELRDRDDPAFHERWAQTAPRDLLTWEWLNRYHRCLNRNPFLRSKK